MSLTTEQKTAILKANSSLQILKDFCKQNEVDLTQILTKEQTQELKEGVAFLKEVMPRLEMADKAVLVDDDGELTIPKGKFISTVPKQLDSIQASNAMKIIQSWSTYSLKITTLNTELDNIELNTPIGKLLKTELQNRTKGAVNVGAVKDAIIKIIGLYNQPKLLATHYNDNKGYYKDEETFIPDVVTDFVTFTENLERCVSEAIDDPRFPANIEKAREKALKEKEIAEKQKEFDLAYSKWYDTSISQVRNINSALAAKELPKDIFILTMNKFGKVWKNAQPELIQKLNLAISENLAKPSVTIAECASAINTALSKEDYKQTIGLEILCGRWQKNSIMPNFDALIGESEKAAKDSLENAYLQKHIDWYKNVFSFIDSLAISSSTRFHKSKVLDSLKTCFDSNEYRLALYPSIETGLNQLSKTPTLEIFIQAWKKSLNEIIINGQLLNQQFTILKNKYPNQTDLENLIKNNINLPNTEELGRAFDIKNKYTYTPPPLPKGENIKLLFAFNDGSLLNAYLKTDIMREGNNVFIVPVGVYLDGEKTGEMGFDFSIGEIAPLNSTTKENTCITPFEFNISFEKNKGSFTKGDEITNEQNISKTKEESDMKGKSHLYNRTGGVSLEVVGYEIEEGDETSEEHTTTNAFTKGSSSSKSISNSTTNEKGLDAGFFNFQFQLESEYLAPTKEGNKGSINATVKLIKSNPKKSKGLVVVVESEVVKGMPATK